MLGTHNTPALSKFESHVPIRTITSHEVCSCHAQFVHAKSCLKNSDAGYNLQWFQALFVHQEQNSPLLHFLHEIPNLPLVDVYAHPQPTHPFSTHPSFNFSIKLCRVIARWLSSVKGTVGIFLRLLTFFMFSPNQFVFNPTILLHFKLGSIRNIPC